MKRITVSFDDDTYKIIRQKAFDRLVSVSKYVSQMVTEYQDQQIAKKISETPKDTIWLGKQKSKSPTFNPAPKDYKDRAEFIEKFNPAPKPKK